MTEMKIVTLIALLQMPTAVVASENRFLDHGVAARTAESRGVVAARDARGKCLVIACSLDRSPRGWILVTDVDHRETKQYWYPAGVPNSPPYASLLSKNGRFCTCAGPTFLEFDINARTWTFHGVPARSESCYTGSAFADGPDGLIYAGSHPHCHLVSFDPRTKKATDYGSMDAQEQYLSYLALDSAGWAYCGIGTARYNIVAFKPATGQRRQIVKEEERKLGTATVYLGTDGTVYGHAGDQWYRLFEGRATPIAPKAAGLQAATGATSWGNTRVVLPDARILRHYDLPERWLEIEDPPTKKVQRITFDYQSEGSQITSLVAGLDGRVYGSTAHPMHFFAYTPDKNAMEDWGPVARVGGGNFCAMAAQGKHIAAPSYASGIFHLFDTAKPFNGGTGGDPNPRELAAWPADICRPRAALAHPDGRHVLMAGYAGYGRRGGGLGICDLVTGKADLITHADLIPDQSTITLKALSSGDLVGGTSVETPGGGHPTAKEGVLYILDWKTRRVAFQTVPVPGAREVFSVETGPDGLVYGLASGSEFFVFDPQRRKVVHRENFSAYGGLVRPALLRGEDGKIYALFTKAIVKIHPGDYRHEKLADAPGSISAGIAIQQGRLYFAVGSHLWSYALRPLPGSRS
jgi:hypothetical protein